MDENTNKPDQNKPTPQRPAQPQNVDTPKTIQTENTKVIKEKKSSGKRGLIIVFLVLLLGINVFQGFMWWKNHSEKKEAKEANVDLAAQRKADGERYEATIDSITTKLEAQMRTVARLNGDTTELSRALRELRSEYSRYKRTNGYAAGKVKKLQQLNNEYVVLLQQQDNELIKLRALTQEQYKNIVELKDTINAKLSVINKQQSIIGNQEELIDLGKILRVEDVQVSIIDSKQKEKLDEKDKGYKNTQIDKLRIEFKIGPNKIAEENTKDFFVIIKEPSGIGLSGDLAGGTFEDKDGKTMYWSAKTSKKFSSGGITAAVMYDKESSYDFKPGKNTVDIYAEGHLIGSGEFMIKK